MVCIHAHFLQVVVLAAHAQAFLRVRDSGVFHGLVAQEQILERVHAGVDEHQGGIVLHHHGCRGYNVVSLFFEKIQKCLPNAP